MAASMFADTCEFAAVGDTVTLDRTGVPRQASPAVPPRTSGLIHMRKQALTVPLPAPIYWQSRHQHTRVTTGGAELSQRIAPQKHRPVIVMIE